MAGTCFTAARGRMMRVTKVNSLGRPVYSGNSFVTTKGFVSVNMSPEVREGETIEVVNAAGEACLAERSCDELNWITVVINFCQVDIALFTLINDTFRELRNAFGETSGFAESYKFSCDSGFGLEIWSDVSGYQPVDPFAEGAWLYYLLSFLVGGTIGEETIENGAVTFNLTARTKKGSNWGVGPHMVEVNDPETGECGPLLDPVADDEPRRRMLVTCPPPDAVCGAQALSDPAAPVLTLSEAPGDPERLTVYAVPPPSGGPYTINWGDSAMESALPANGATHTYASRGEYVITLWATATPALKRYAKVSVPYGGTAPLNVPMITASEDVTDPTRMSVSVLVDNHTNGTVTLDWGDGTADGSNVGDGTTPTTHKYVNDGTYTITATDNTDATLTSTRQVAVAYGGGLALTASVVESSPAGPARRTVTATWDNAEQGPVTIDWNDGSAVETVAEAGTTNHVYANAGTYSVIISDASNATRTETVPVTVPFTS